MLFMVYGLLPGYRLFETPVLPMRRRWNKLHKHSRNICRSWLGLTSYGLRGEVLGESLGEWLVGVGTWLRIFRIDGLPRRSRHCFTSHILSLGGTGLSFSYRSTSERLTG